MQGELRTLMRARDIFNHDVENMENAILSEKYIPTD